MKKRNSIIKLQYDCLFKVAMRYLLGPAVSAAEQQIRGMTIFKNRVVTEWLLSRDFFQLSPRGLTAGPRSSPLKLGFIKRFVTLCTLLASLYVPLSFAQEKMVNIYNWAAYIPDSVIKEFTQETGIRVNYATFDSNEILYTKLKVNPHTDYDVVMPSTYIVQRMIKEGMLHPLDKSKLSNMKYLDPKLLNKAYDPNNRYSLPYLWGTTGLFVNRKYYNPAELSDWKDLWNKRWVRQIALLDDVRDVMGMGLKVLGYSINDRDPQHIQQAYLKLKELMNNVLLFTSDGSQQLYVNEEVGIGMIASGDASMVMRENNHYSYIFPKDGPLIWIDSMVIPVGAKHLNNAYRFINFILRPEIAKQISEGVGYSTANQAALQLMSQEMQNNPIFNPKASDIAHGEVEEDLDPTTAQLYLKYWELLKIGI